MKHSNPCISWLAMQLRLATDNNMCLFFCLPGFPRHELTLKPGCIVILLRTISQQERLCNGTRLRVLAATNNAVLCETLQQPIQQHWICRVIFKQDQPSKQGFILRRRQFPLRLGMQPFDTTLFSFDVKYWPTQNFFRLLQYCEHTHLTNSNLFSILHHLHNHFMLHTVLSHPCC